jgi:hypothetical protein
MNCNREKRKNLVNSGQLNLLINHLLNVFHAKIADADAPDVSLLLDITNGFPTFLPNPRASQWGVHQVQINVPQLARLQRGLNGFFGCLVSIIVPQFGREEHIRTRCSGGAEIANSAPAFRFVLIPSSRVLMQLSRNERHQDWKSDNVPITSLS